MLEAGLRNYQERATETEKKYGNSLELEEKKNEPKYTFYFFMRHGERTDFYFGRETTPDKYKGHVNAPPYINNI